MKKNKCTQKTQNMQNMQHHPDRSNNVKEQTFIKKMIPHSTVASITKSTESKQKEQN